MTQQCQHVPCGQCQDNGWMEWRDDVKEAMKEMALGQKAISDAVNAMQLDSERARSACQQKNLERFSAIEKDVAQVKRDVKWFSAITATVVSMVTSFGADVLKIIGR